MGKYKNNAQDEVNKYILELIIN